MLDKLLNNNERFAKYFPITYMFTSFLFFFAGLFILYISDGQYKIGLYLILLSIITISFSKYVSKRYGRGVVTSRRMDAVQNEINVLKTEDIYHKVNVLSSYIGRRDYNFGLVRFHFNHSFYIFNDTTLITKVYIDHVEKQALRVKYSNMIIKYLAIKKNSINIVYSIVGDKNEYEFACDINRSFNGYIMETEFDNNEDAFDRFVSIIQNLYNRR